MSECIIREHGLHVLKSVQREDDDVSKCEFTARFEVFEVTEERPGAITYAQPSILPMYACGYMWSALHSGYPRETLDHECLHSLLVGYWQWLRERSQTWVRSGDNLELLSAREDGRIEIVMATTLRLQHQEIVPMPEYLREIFCHA